jgi:hypothetical protein
LQVASWRRDSPAHPPIPTALSWPQAQLDPRLGSVIFTSRARFVPIEPAACHGWTCSSPTPSLVCAEFRTWMSATRALMTIRSKSRPVLPSMWEWNREKQISRVVFHLQANTRGGDIAPTRYKLVYQLVGKTARCFFVRQMSPAYIGILTVFPSNGESIDRHRCKLRDRPADTCDFRHSQ